MSLALCGARAGARRAPVAPKKGKAGKKATPAKKAPTGAKKAKGGKDAKGARDGSKTAKVLDLLKRPGGRHLADAIASMPWLCGLVVLIKVLDASKGKV